MVTVEANFEPECALTMSKSVFDLLPNSIFSIKSTMTYFISSLVASLESGYLIFSTIVRLEEGVFDTFPSDLIFIVYALRLLVGSRRSSSLCKPPASHFSKHFNTSFRNCISAILNKFIHFPESLL